VLQAAAAAAMSPLPNPRTPIVPAAAAEAAARRDTNKDPHAGTRRALFGDGGVHDAATTQSSAAAAAAAADPEAKRQGKLTLLSKQVGEAAHTQGCFRDRETSAWGCGNCQRPKSRKVALRKSTLQRVCGCLLTRASPERRSG